MAECKPVYRPQTIRETLERIEEMPRTPWVPIGDFLDDWRRLQPSEQAALVSDPPGAAHTNSLDILRWRAFLAAAVESLCRSRELPFPTWTAEETTYLREPWFLYPGDSLRPWQLATTPTPFRMRNIFGGDRILDRV